jgi:hypothetical protein
MMNALANSAMSNDCNFCYIGKEEWDLLDSPTKNYQ